MIRSLSRSAKGLKLWNISSGIKQNDALKTLPPASNAGGNSSRHVKISKDKNLPYNSTSLIFTPHTIGIIEHPQNEWSLPPLPYKPPNLENIDGDFDILSKIEDSIFPTQTNIEEIQAARLIVIRRKKMKKHQRRKLYKRMKFKWAKKKINRKIRKEKAFQAELVAMVKSAENFSAEDYVKEKLEQANYQPLPTRWKGKRLPEFIIRQLMGLDKKINYKHSDIYKA